MAKLKMNKEEECIAKSAGEVSEELKGVVEALDALIEDNTVPKNVRIKLEAIIVILRSDCEDSIKINRALDELEEIQSDVNLQSFTRTQIWNITTLLETA